MAREAISRRRRSQDDTDTSKYLAKGRDEDDSDDADDEDEKPSRGSRRGSRRGSEEKSSGRGSRRGRVHSDDDDDDEDEKPTRRRNRAKDDDEDKKERSSRRAATGWDGYEETKVSQGNYPDKLEVGSEESLIKFLDDGPFAVFKMHWLNWRDGKKSWNCLESDGCPICDMTGDKPRQQAMFNVVEFPEDGSDPHLVVWTTSQTVAGQIKTLSKSDKTGPVNREDLYFAVKKSGKGKKTTYSIQAVKERDLEEDWDTTPLTEAELDAFDADAWDNEVVYYNTKREMREIAEEMLDEG